MATKHFTFLLSNLDALVETCQCGVVGGRREAEVSFEVESTSSTVSEKDE